MASQPLSNVVLTQLQSLANHPNAATVASVLSELASLFDRGNTQHIEMVHDYGIVPNMIAEISHPDAEVQRAAMHATGNMMVISDAQIQSVLDFGLLQQISQLLLSDSNYTAKTDAVVLLSNITPGSSEHIQAIFDAGLIPTVVKLLATGDFRMKKEAAWTIAGITINGSAAQVSCMVDNGVLNPFCELLVSRDVQIVQVVLSGLNNLLRIVDDKNRDAICQILDVNGGLDTIKNLRNREIHGINQLAQTIIGQFPTELRSTGPHEDVAYAEPHENAMCRFVKTDSAKRALQLRIATFVGKYAKASLRQSNARRSNKGRRQRSKHAVS